MTVCEHCAAFALPERPRAYVCDDDAMRCPWCNHLPTNQGIDSFWVLSDAHGVARARIGRVRVEEDPTAVIPKSLDQ